MIIYLNNGFAYQTIPRDGKPQLEEPDLQMHVYRAFQEGEGDVDILDAIFDAGYTIQTI